MNFSIRFATALTAFLLAPLMLIPGVSAQNVVITTAVPFLQIEPDSRAAGMGMAGVAVADNAYAPYWNPAGLAGQEGTEVSFTHAPWLPALGADLSFEYLSGKYNLGNAGTLGGHLTYFNLGEQTWTRDDGQELGTFSSYELAAGLSYGIEVMDGLALGTGGRIIYSNLTGGQSVGNTATQAGLSVGVDLGLKYDTPSFDVGGVPVQPSLAFNLANMGPAISYVASDSISVPNPIPTNLRFGGAMAFNLDEFNTINVALDFNKLLVNRDEETMEYDTFPTSLFSSWGAREVNSRASSGETCDDLASDDDAENNCRTLGVLQQLTLGTGVEYWYNDLLALRTGYFYEDPANGNRQFLTFGSGLRYSLVGVDMSYIFALEEGSPVANQLRFSLLLNVPR